MSEGFDKLLLDRRADFHAAEFMLFAEDRYVEMDGRIGLYSGDLENKEIFDAALEKELAGLCRDLRELAYLSREKYLEKKNGKSA